MSNLYDTVGAGYPSRRRPDPRIATAIAAALGDARSIVNVGAGTGSYEPADRRVVAVEPAAIMIRQRASGAAPVVRAVAHALPFVDGAFAASLAVLTVHHWPDRRAGLAELARVARERVVVFTWDASTDFWLLDYTPALAALDREIFAPFDEYRDVLGAVDVVPVPIPHDCVDGFLGAYWRRPAAYLDPAVRAGMSTFARVDDRAGLARLERDLADGTWHRRHGALLEQDALDCGYRLVIARRDA